MMICIFEIKLEKLSWVILTYVGIIDMKDSTNQPPMVQEQVWLYKKIKFSQTSENTWQGIRA